MAKTRSGSGPKAQPLALELLMADHRKVEDLFEQYDSEKESDEDTRRELANRICGELTVHATLEEEIFYPWLRENLEDTDMLEEAYVEHAGAKDLIAQIEGAREVDDTFNAKVKVLSEYIKHHVKEEEQEIFAEIRDKKDELDELGQQIASRKGELTEELGLTEDSEEGDEEETPAPRGKSASRESTQRGPR